MSDIHLPLRSWASNAVIEGPCSHKVLMDAAEEAILRAMLAKHEGQRNRVAKELGINRTTLFNKMTKFGLMDEFRRHKPRTTESSV